MKHNDTFCDTEFNGIPNCFGGSPHLFPTRSPGTKQAARKKIYKGIIVSLKEAVTGGNCELI